MSGTKLESTARVPVELDSTEAVFVTGTGDGIELSYDQDLRAHRLDRPGKRLILYAYAHTGSISAASRIVLDGSGRPAVTVHQHQHWHRTDPEYRALYEELKEAVNARWEEVLEGTAVKGLRTEVRDRDGNLKETVDRQDATILRMVLAAKMAKYRQSEKSSGVNIQINIERPEE